MVLSKNPTLAKQKKELHFEDEVVRSIEFRELSYARRILFILGCIFSVGILALICHWFHRLYVILNYRKTTPRNCTKVIVTDEHNACHSCDKIMFEENGTNLALFQFKRLLYSYDHQTNQFSPVRFETAKPFFFYETVMSKGVSIESVETLRILNQINSIAVPITPLYKLILDEGLHPFICFQIFSVVIWSLFDYYYYASLIAVITIFSVVIQIVQTRINQRNLKEMTKFECRVQVHRRRQTADGTYEAISEEVSSKDLVPGDVIEVPNGFTMPCDALLLHGQCIMNETMLTGESIPVIKNGIPHILPPMQCDALVESAGRRNTRDEEQAMLPLLSTVRNVDILHMERDKSYVLFGGTKVVRARGHVAQQDGSSRTVGTDPLAIVLRTSFATAKGQLVRSILYPKPTKFKFYEDSFKFIAVLGCIAFLGFIANAIIQAMYETEVMDIVLRAGDLVTIAVPPTLPAVMSAGISYALSRLKKKGIFCIASQRVNMAGKLKVVCFDKTGTLTDEDLSVLGVQDVVPTGSHSTEQSKSASENNVDPSLTPAASPSCDDETKSDVTMNSLMSGETRMDHTRSETAAAERVHHVMVEPAPTHLNALTPSPTTRATGPMYSPGISDTAFSTLKTTHTEFEDPMSPLVAALASCHSVATVDGHNIGDPLDVKMLEFTKWTMVEKSDTTTWDNTACKWLGDSASVSKYEAIIYPPLCAATAVPAQDRVPTTNAPATTSTSTSSSSSSVSMVQMPESSPSTALGIIRRFDFSSHLQRMSVVVQRYSSTGTAALQPHGHLDIFTKGSPEVLTTLCDPSSIPVDFTEQLASFTQRGLRVLAIAHRTIPHFSQQQLQNLQREDIETGLSFLGFFVLENRLRPESTPTLASLTAACIRSLMVTGDNPLTAINVARECGLIPTPPLQLPSSAEEAAVHRDAAVRSGRQRRDGMDTYPVFIAELNDHGEVTWNCHDFPDWTLDPQTLFPIPRRASSVSSNKNPSSSMDSIVGAPTNYGSFSDSSEPTIPAPNEDEATSPSTTSQDDSLILSNPNSFPSSSNLLPNVSSTSPSSSFTPHLNGELPNPFADWKGGPWAPLYWRNQGYPTTFGSTSTNTSVSSPPPSSAYMLAVTGAAFRKMYQDDLLKYPPKTHLRARTQNSSSSTASPLLQAQTYTQQERSTSVFRQVCFLSPVFARMSPDDKATLVETLIDMGFVTGMCGDGANDCGALKAAHVGISLSEVEASIAAPFTSKIPNIKCVEILILEGRAALSSSFHAFKATAIFSMIQFVSTAILIGYDTMLSDFDFLLIDILMTLPVLFTTGYARPAPALSRKSPNGSLVSFRVISSLFLHILVTFCIQFIGVFVILPMCSDYVPLDWEEEDYDLHIESFETSTIFLISLVSYIVSGIVINLWDPFLEPFFKNILLLVSFAFVTFIGFYCVFSQAEWFITLMQLVRSDETPMVTFWLVSFVASFIVLTIFEYGLCQLHLPKVIHRRLHPDAKYRPREVKRRVTNPETSSTYTMVENVYKKPFYAIFDHVKRLGASFSA